mmetsp:Transcript_15592/g.33126  ORF Transcript_15592/g.33126 Transcript_15592/m.33126 type:complete len:218 (+) Transcript_15592:787-1440(+)
MRHEALAVARNTEAAGRVLRLQDLGKWLHRFVLIDDVRLDEAAATGAFVHGTRRVLLLRRTKDCSIRVVFGEHGRGHGAEETQALEEFQHVFHTNCCVEATLHMKLAYRSTIITKAVTTSTTTRRPFRISTRLSSGRGHGGAHGSITTAASLDRPAEQLPQGGLELVQRSLEVRIRQKGEDVLGAGLMLWIEDGTQMLLEEPMHLRRNPVLVRKTHK